METRYDISANPTSVDEILSLRELYLFSVLLSVSGAEAIETQSNDSMLTTMLHTFARSVKSESILFHDTNHFVAKASGPLSCKS